MTWEQAGSHAYKNGAKAISKKFLDGCSLYCAHDGADYIKHSEDEAEAVLSLIHDKTEMLEFLAVVREKEGSEYMEKLRQECLKLWNERAE